MAFSEVFGTRNGAPAAPLFLPPGGVGGRVRRYTAGRWDERPDTLAAEEPLEVRLLWQEPDRLARKSIAITMRTPGAPGEDFELAAGFLFAEGIVRGPDDIVDVSYCTDEAEEQVFNIVSVTLRPGLTFDPARLERNFYTTSSCGICGKATLEALDLRGCAPLPSGFVTSADVICRAPAALRAAQTLFERTGGVHGAALLSADGRLLGVREDVGRHNAVDKLIGAQVLLNNLPLAGTLLVLSGRASFELLQKALVAGIPVVAAVGAPSGLAVQLAEAFNITLAGFVRPSGFNLYTAPERIAGPTSPPNPVSDT